MAEKQEKEARLPARWDPFGELIDWERGWPFREMGGPQRLGLRRARAETLLSARSAACRGASRGP